MKFATALMLLAMVAGSASLAAGSQATGTLQQLESAFGPPSQKGFGSAVFHEPLLPGADLEQAALAKYRYFVGPLWDRYGAEAWMGPWRKVYTRASGGHRDVVAELRGIEDAEARRSTPLLLEAPENAAGARAALVAGFDDPAVSELGVFNVGDGEQMSGLLVAARRAATGDAIYVIVLMD